MRPWRFIDACLLVALVTTGHAVFGEIPATNAGNPGAVRGALAAGEGSLANAAWWGFDREDATDSIQAAIDSGAKTVVIPYMGAPWVVRPITLAGDQEVIFEPGVVVLAKQDEFKGKGDSLFTAPNVNDLTLRGYGATLRMRKQDYQSDAYDKAEWRMVLDLEGCRRVNVMGLTLESSGGDGIYVGVGSGDRPYCEDVVIRDVTCHDNHRQGISVISAVNLLIENCVLSNTDGTAPQAGIDFEPNRPNERLENCVVRNCVMAGNSGAGILVYLKQLARESAPVSILFENCYVYGGKDVGIGVGAVKDDGPGGLIEFKNCTIENSERGGVFVYDKSADSARVRFENCRWSGVGLSSRGKKAKTPLLLTPLRPELTKKLGGIDFAECHVFDDLDRPALVAEGKGKDLGIHDLKGQITVHNPHGARIELPAGQFDVGLTLISATE